MEWGGHSTAQLRLCRRRERKNHAARSLLQPSLWMLECYSTKRVYAVFVAQSQLPLMGWISLAYERPEQKKCSPSTGSPSWEPTLGPITTYPPSLDSFDDAAAVVEAPAVLKRHTVEPEDGAAWEVGAPL